MKEFENLYIIEIYKTRVIPITIHKPSKYFIEIIFTIWNCESINGGPYLKTVFSVKIFVLQSKKNSIFQNGQ